MNNSNKSYNLQYEKLPQEPVVEGTKLDIDLLLSDNNARNSPKKKTSNILHSQDSLAVRQATGIGDVIHLIDRRGGSLFE